MFIRFFLMSVLVMLLLGLSSCEESPKKKSKETPRKISIVHKKSSQHHKEKSRKKQQDFTLTTDNAIDFFYHYSKTHRSNKVRIVVNGYGNIDILLYDNTPYHRANFIYLTERHYFEGSCFHRVVKGFIIQGGSSDNYGVMKKRHRIGKYLLPPDAKKGHKHHRGTISMPSSDIDNPHLMASPYEFFIVQQNPGAYHLDGKYTAFGQVIDGMDVVDKINALATDKRDWPEQNIIIDRVEILD